MMVLPAQSPNSLGFRVFLVLNWLPTKARELCSLCKLFTPSSVGDERIHNFPMVIVRKWTQWTLSEFDPCTAILYGVQITTTLYAYRLQMQTPLHIRYSNSLREFKHLYFNVHVYCPCQIGNDATKLELN